MNRETKVPRSVGTHSGSFHADEVSACALLVVYDLVDSDKIVRTRDPEKLSRCAYVCDVGGFYDPAQGLFDHHQVEYQGQMSSAGMILKYLMDEKIITEEEHLFFRENLIEGVDDHDNGRSEQVPGICTFSHVIANFSPVDYDAGDEEFEAGFLQAFTFVRGHLERLRARHQYTLGCKEVVAQAMEGAKECLFFDHKLPWIENFFTLGGEQHQAQFVIMPSGDHWKLRGIPPNWQDRMAVRVPLPQEWAGLHDDDLKKVSGIPGAIFCHKGRFISVWETKEDALRALDYTLKHT